MEKLQVLDLTIPIIYGDGKLKDENNRIERRLFQHMLICLKKSSNITTYLIVLTKMKNMNVLEE